MSEADNLEEVLAGLKSRHRELDEEIDALTGGYSSDQLTIQRLKREKLQIKDEISQVKAKLLPDIIA